MIIVKIAGKLLSSVRHVWLTGEPYVPGSKITLAHYNHQSLFIKIDKTAAGLLNSVWSSQVIIKSPKH